MSCKRAIHNLIYIFHTNISGDTPENAACMMCQWGMSLRWPPVAFPGLIDWYPIIYLKHQISKLKCFSSHIVVAFTQYVEARC